MKPELLFQAVQQYEVDAVLIGGMAAYLRGVPRTTNDIDFCYDPSPDNRRKLVQALRPYNPQLRVAGMADDEASTLPFIWDERTLRDTPNLTLHTDAGDIDLMPQVAGIGGYAEVRLKAKPLRVRGMTLMALDLPELITAKQAANRPKDQLHLPEIEAALLLRERNARRASRRDD